MQSEQSQKLKDKILYDFTAMRTLKEKKKKLAGEQNDGCRKGIIESCW